MEIPRRQVFGPGPAPNSHFVGSQICETVARAVEMDLDFYNVDQSKRLTRRTVNHIANEVK